MSDNENANVDMAKIHSGNANEIYGNANNSDTINKALAILLGKDNVAPSAKDETEEQQAEDSENNEEKPAPVKGARPKTMADAAKQLGMSIEDLYGLEVSIADGQDAEKFSIGALKDAMKERTDFKFQQLEWGETKSQQEGELLRSRNELVEIMTSLPPGTIKPETVKAIREKHEATLKLERERTLNVIREWNDETKRAEDISAMNDHLDRAGFPKNYIKNVSDHRTLRYIRDNMLREKRITEALAMVKKQTPKGQAPSPRGNTLRGGVKPTNQQRGITGESRKVDAVRDLLLNNIRGT